VLNLAIRDDYGYPKPLIELPAYTWPGGYPLIYLTRGGDTLCADCATKDIRAWMYGESDDPPIAFGPYYEGPVIQCDDCNRDIESAYGDPEDSQ